jgi:hypothetical protein
VIKTTINAQYCATVIFITETQNSISKYLSRLLKSIAGIDIRDHRLKNVPMVYQISDAGGVQGYPIFMSTIEEFQLCCS